jgi:4-hydroxybenzoyl-CoA thioesterase
MFTHRRQLRIEWGDCDPAGIVFYPRYFAMFNHSTELAVEAALGINKQELFKSLEFGGMPAIETRARFLIPTRYCDDIVIDTSITEVRRTSFLLQHRLLKNGGVAVEGFEARVWVVRDPERPGRFRPQPIPQHIVARLRGETSPATAPI